MSSIFVIHSFMTNKKAAPTGVLTMEILEEAYKKAQEDGLMSRPLYHDSELAQIFDELNRLEKERKRKREQKQQVMQHKGVVLRNKRSGVDWEITGTTESTLPSHLANWQGDQIIKNTTIKSKNSGKRKSINPLLSLDRYDVVYIPEAAKVLYGWEEDESNT